MKLLAGFIAVCLLLAGVSLALSVAVWNSLHGADERAQERIQSPVADRAIAAAETSPATSPGASAPASPPQDSAPDLAAGPVVPTAERDSAIVAPAAGTAAPESTTAAPVSWVGVGTLADRQLLRSARAALQREPQHPQALRDAAHAAAQLGDGRAAVGYLRQLVAGPAAEWADSRRLAYLLTLLEGDLAALDVLKAAVARYPREPQAWDDLADLSGRLGHLRAACDARSSALQLAPSARRFAARGAALVELGDWSAARADLARALADLPTERALVFMYAVACERDGTAAQAIAPLERLLADQTRDVELLLRLAALHRANEEHPAARRYCREALALDPGSGAARALLAELR